MQQSHVYIPKRTYLKTGFLRRSAMQTAKVLQSIGLPIEVDLEVFTNQSAEWKTPMGDIVFSRGAPQFEEVTQTDAGDKGQDGGVVVSGADGDPKAR